MKFYYNGVLLPEIPADVLAEYPYCWIRKDQDGVTYNLVCSKYAWYFNGQMCIKASTYNHYNATLESESWVFEISYTDSGDYGIANGVLWANHCISSTIGEIYLEGTEPIPEIPYEMYQIRGNTLEAFANEARRINGTTDHLTTDQMIEIFKQAGGGMDGLENGYDVMFYDENNEGLAFYSIKQGHTINPPVYECKKWVLENGDSVFFPLIPSGDMVVFANNDSMVSGLYEHYNVDKVLYPYVLMYITSGRYLGITFAETIELQGTTTIFRGLSGNTTLTQAVMNSIDIANIDDIMGAIMTYIKNVSSNYNNIGSGNFIGVYANFDHNTTGTQVTMRID